ncbi:hypothetical protein AJ78_05115 [Emergomyces pasteurianus Ep9510]|uniref:Roadblock/LAMTOR2 domain-containing protein n=1 Tax=Emergomyces pasteurianus Ep9510 TaxID=1447872 RepID=A0A1J9PEV0_9EURO|nr:hypothetical protein AJ78_05115 [Emergomyces pasteurianus Ep9510]
MATRAQLPRHVSAHLSNLTSRPGVQSTLILSRKDGSIIRTTGLLATRANPSPTGPSPASATGAASIPDSVPATTTPPTSDQQLSHLSTDETGEEAAHKQAQEQQEQHQQQHPQPQQPATLYKPSQAETLAAHIFAFVSCASALSTSLSKPPPSATSNGGNGGGSSYETGYGESGTIGTAAGRGVTTNGHARNENAESEGHEREEDDELKLLRLRTKIHEIIIIPDRKFLLCVVHDLSGASGGAAGSGSKGGGLSG